MALDEYDPDLNAALQTDGEDLRGLGFPKTPLGFLCELWVPTNHEFKYHKSSAVIENGLARSFVVAMGNEREEGGEGRGGGESERA